MVGVDNNSDSLFRKTKQINESKSIGQQVVSITKLIEEVILLCFQVLYSLAESLYRLIVPTSQKPVKGEIVLITGAGHGIGKELAFLYAAKGATVVGWDVNVKNNEKTISEINARDHPKAYAYYCDVSNKEQVFEVAEKVRREVGDVTILINNAGIMPTHPILDQTKKEIESIFGINVLAHLWTIQAFLPAMKKNNHGHIVGLSSCAGVFGTANLVPYSGTKFAVVGIMEALREELRLDKNCKIETTCICPSIVDTGFCKNPQIRFKNTMPLLTAKFTAEAIMKAQQTNQRLITVPIYMMFLLKLRRLFPIKTGNIVMDFIGYNIGSDLPLP